MKLPGNRFSKGMLFALEMKTLSTRPASSQLANRQAGDRSYVTHPNRKDKYPARVGARNSESGA